MQWVNAVPFDDIGHKNMRALMCGLTRECPFGGNPEDCCMYEIRKMPYAERFKWVNELSTVQLETIYHNHLKCSRCKSSD